MNGDNIVNLKTGETYEEYGFRIRDERIAELESDTTRLIDVLKSARKVYAALGEFELIRRHSYIHEDIVKSVEACADIGAGRGS